MPRVVVPAESEETVLDQSHRRRKGLLIVLGLLSVVAAVGAALVVYRARAPKPSADTVFVSAPAWPKGDPRQASPKPLPPLKEWLLQVGAFVSKRDADALAARLAGVGFPVSVVVPVSATDSLNKVMVSGIVDKATARRLADSLGKALARPITIIEPTGIRAK